VKSNPNKDILNKFIIRNNFQYGDLGMVLALHGELYYSEYQLNHEFEAYVAEGLAEFAKIYQEGKSRLWIAEFTGKAIGTLAIMERPEQQGQIRWFLIHPDYRGIGLGKLLVEKAINFCRDAGYQSIFLWTLENLTAARAIYEKYGFRLKEEKEHFLWGQNLIEQYYVLNLKKKM
jgi:GNAT superfamily N-acetyltransferase